MYIIPDGEGNIDRILGDRTMKIGLEAEYALIAMAYIAQHSQDGPIRAGTISEAYGLSSVYLHKILGALAKAGILKSKRGLGGGYALARPAREINVLEIIESVPGPFGRITEIARQAGKAPFAVNMEQVCNEAFAKARDRFRKATLSKMIG